MRTVEQLYALSDIAMMQRRPPEMDWTAALSKFGDFLLSRQRQTCGHLQRLTSLQELLKLLRMCVPTHPWLVRVCL